jgi:rhodanese-related sulfurtransferase
LNALPKESYEEKHIPGSLNLPHDTVLKEIPEILESYKKKTKLGKYPLNILPVVLYCAHSECSASDKLMKKLEELDMVNVSEYSGGMKEWFSTEPQVDSPVTPEPDTKDMYDLNIEKETLLYDTIEYIHDLKSNDVFTKDNEKNRVGFWDGENIKWEGDSDNAHALLKKKQLDSKNDYLLTISSEEEDDDELEEDELEDDDDLEDDELEDDDDLEDDELEDDELEDDEPLPELEEDPEDKLVVFRIICKRHLNSNPCQIGGYSNIITRNLPGFTFF